MKKMERPLGLVILVLLALAGAGCKGRQSRVTVENEEEPAGPASVVRMNDPAAGTQLVSGFYGLEGGSWRWTARKFSAQLGVPPAATQNGATLTFAFSVPDVAIQKFGALGVTASIKGTTLKTQQYDKAGRDTFSADVPASLLTGNSVKVDFALDKTLPPSGGDKRELGVIATSVGLSAK